MTTPTPGQDVGSDQYGGSDQPGGGGPDGSQGNEPAPTQSWPQQPTVPPSATPAQASASVPPQLDALQNPVTAADAETSAAQTTTPQTTTPQTTTPQTTTAQAAPPQNPSQQNPFPQYQQSQSPQTQYPQGQYAQSPYPPGQSSQSQYPQNPYPQGPYPPDQQQNPAYQSAGTYAAPGAYGQPSYGYQPYPGSDSYPGAAGYPPLPVTDTNPWGGLGLASMICAGVALVLGIIITLVMSNGFSAVLSSLPSSPSGSGTVDTSSLTPDQQTQLARAGGAAIAMFLPSLIGLAAFITGIVAVNRQRGRQAGIAGIIVSVLSPIICVIVLTATLGGAITRLGG